MPVRLFFVVSFPGPPSPLFGIPFVLLLFAVLLLRFGREVGFEEHGMQRADLFARGSTFDNQINLMKTFDQGTANRLAPLVAIAFKGAFGFSIQKPSVGA